MGLGNTGEVTGQEYDVSVGSIRSGETCPRERHVPPEKSPSREHTRRAVSGSIPLRNTGRKRTNIVEVASG